MAKAADLLHRQLARHHHPPDAKPFGEAGRLGAGDGHLRRGVDIERGADRARKQRDGGILHDDGVDACLGDLREEFLDHRELRFEDQRVQREVGLGIRPVDGPNRVGQGRNRKVGGARTGIEAIIESEIDRVRSRGERGAQRLGITCRSEDFR